MKQESLKFSGRASNPATKKFSPAQIAAQKLFAERARAGTLGKAVKRNPVKANPVQDAGEFVMTVNGKSKTRFFVTDDNQWANSYGFNYRLLSDVTKYGSPVKFTKTRAIVAIDEGADGKPITDTWNIRGLKFYKTNPDKSKPRAYVKRASQATGAPPSKRLVTRRKKALTAPAGYFPNPYTMGKSKKKANFPFCVETKATENWSTKACFKTMQPAKEYAVALSKQYPNLAIRVMHYAGGAM